MWNKLTNVALLFLKHAKTKKVRWIKVFRTGSVSFLQMNSGLNVDSWATFLSRNQSDGTQLWIKQSLFERLRDYSLTRVKVWAQRKNWSDFSAAEEDRWNQQAPQSSPAPRQTSHNNALISSSPHPSTISRVSASPPLHQASPSLPLHTSHMTSKQLLFVHKPVFYLYFKVSSSVDPNLLLWIFKASRSAVGRKVKVRPLLEKLGIAGSRLHVGWNWRPSHSQINLNLKFIPYVPFEGLM